MGIKVNDELCTGCRLCEMECSFAHEGKFGTYLSRIRVNKMEDVGIDYPVVCQMCTNAPCIAACPNHALSKSAKGTVVLDESKCTSCGTCVEACPFGAMNLHPLKGLPISCDLCGGDPKCVTGCPTGALEIVEPSYPKRERELELIRIAQAKRDRFTRKAASGLIKEWGVEG